MLATKSPLDGTKIPWSGEINHTLMLFSGTFKLIGLVKTLIRENALDMMSEEVLSNELMISIMSSRLINLNGVTKLDKLAKTMLDF